MRSSDGHSSNLRPSAWTLIYLGEIHVETHGKHHLRSCEKASGEVNPANCLAEDFQPLGR